jgi:hypothetical protein
MSSPTPYHRCLHCKGFYESDRPRCKWCKYQTPLLDEAGQPRTYPDRQTCRAIQIAEWQQLPEEVRTDPMGPPKNELSLLCNCLHCGPEGHTFEAVEMRWLDNEQMWACPCTTCGGRGFQFDIHSAEQKWQCYQCGHFYTPANNDYRHENARCPKCGCTEASGWFDDGYDEDDFADEEFEDVPPDPATRDRGPNPFADEELPWDDEDDDDDDGPEYDLGITWKESDDDRSFASDAEIPFGDDDDHILDDIDNPRFFRTPDDKPLNEDDIPF